MRASRPKVLDAIGGRSLIAHVLTSAGTVGGAQAVVVGPAQGADQQAVVAAVKAAMPSAVLFVQGERRGTAHAVLAAKPALARGADDVLIVFADTPLITPQTLPVVAVAQGAAVAVPASAG
jgi:bifunctional UDP-N-acetylglucosamine pyrophosphorylase/glucosamine-1-phosphate N-acetyltransferase